MMTDTEYDAQVDGEFARHKAARRALKIQRWGACTDYKGHFDKSSFGFGLLCGAWVAAVGIALIHQFWR